jgi:alpha-tubulin suppressor-like RCC1 family protein
MAGFRPGFFYFRVQESFVMNRRRALGKLLVGVAALFFPLRLARAQIVKGFGKRYRLSGGAGGGVGGLFSWGLNTSGQLGLSNTTQMSTPTAVGASGWTKVRAGKGFAMGISPSGTLFSWGTNNLGQLGLNSIVSQSSPVQVGALSDWSDIACADHVLAVKLDGSLWGWGSNTIGQLGLSATGNKSSPVQIGALSWRSVAVGGSTSAAIRTDNTLWAWGGNGNFQLGNGSSTANSSPIQVGSSTNWSSVAVGPAHMLAVKSDGTLWAWGYNGSGQLGLSDTTMRSTVTQVGALTNWMSVAAGGVAAASGFSAGLKNDGSLFTWGVNTSGKLGLSDTVTRSSPTQVGAALDWREISLGQGHALALRGSTSKSLWSWGEGGNGQLGTGSTMPVSSPVMIGTSNWASISCSNSVSSYGLNVP